MVTHSLVQIMLSLKNEANTNTQISFPPLCSFLVLLFSFCIEPRLCFLYFIVWSLLYKYLLHHHHHRQNVRAHSVTNLGNVCVPFCYFRAHGFISDFFVESPFGFQVICVGAAATGEALQPTAPSFNKSSVYTAEY